MRKPSKEILATLAKNVRRFRLENGMSQELLAERCGLHRTYIGSIERGERNATLSTLEVLAETFNVSIAQLLNNNE